MKAASSATLALLAAGEYAKCELYDITLTTGQIYRFTDAQTPLSAAVYPSASVFTYQTGLTLTRDTITQKASLEAGSMRLTVAPQADSPNAPVLIAGYPLLQACRYGFFDGALVRMSKLFTAPPSGGPIDTSPGGVGWFLGTVQDVDAGRLSVDLTIDDYLAYMNNQQMPRNVWQTGCAHKVYDAGCTLLRGGFTVTGTISTSGDGAHFTTNLTQADHYFELGVITFTSGVNNGLSASVSRFLHASGTLVTCFPFPQKPGVGDAFSIYPGCDLSQATCTTKFSNLAHFMGTPYIPVAETPLDGGTDNPPVQTKGSQAGQVIGSAIGARNLIGTFKT